MGATRLQKSESSKPGLSSGTKTIPRASKLAILENSGSALSNNKSQGSRKRKIANL